MSSVTLFSCACAMILFASVVTPSPTLPEVGLKDMGLEHACLFMCEMCFTGFPKPMMYCANEVCAAGTCNAPGMVWVGRACKNPALLDKFLAK